MTVHAFGWVRDLPDFRDYSIARLPNLAAASTPLPPHVDLRETGWLPPVKDQGQLGSCTANGICSQLEFEAARQGETVVPLSRLWLYWQERKLEGTIDSDAGANPRDGFKVANHTGIPAESEWPYFISKWMDTPPDFADEAQHRALVYAAVPQTTTAIERVLASQMCVALGFTCYQSLESDKVATTGIVPMPSASEQVIGGHFVVLVGFKVVKHRKHFIFLNSWGDWGDAGFGYIPAKYVTNPQLAGDLWAVSSVS